MKRLAAAAVLLVLVAASCTADEPGDAAADVYDGPRVQAPPHPLGLKYDLNRSETFAPYLRRLAGGTTFFMLVWCDVEPEQGELDWADADRAVELASRLGYRMALHVRIGSCWSTGGRVGEARGRRAVTPSAPPRDVAAYRAFVRAAVDRYKRYAIHDYAIENEVNAAAFWRGTAQEYEELVAVAAREIRQADPDARVFDSGLSSTAYGAGIADDLRRAGRPDDAVAAYNRYYSYRAATRPRDFPVLSSPGDLEGALTNEQGRRNLEYLASTERLVRDRTVDALQLHFYEGHDAARDLMEYVRAHSPAGTTVEVWELGMYRPGERRTDQIQAEQLARAVVSLLAGGVRRVVYLPAAYDPAGRRETEMRWGLLRPDGTAGQAAELYVALAEATSEATLESIGGGPIEGVLAERPAKTTAVVWSDSGARLAGTPPAGATAVGASGRTIPWGPAGLALDAQPVMVTVPGDGAALRQLLAAASRRA